jgi:integrase
MARHIRNARVESRSARMKLTPSQKPVYFGCGGGLAVGYRRGKNAGVWVARRYLGAERYVTSTLAEADDLADANGVTVLDFNQAQDRARAWASDLDERERISALGPVVSVADAANEYLNERRPSRDAQGKLNHILANAALAKTKLAALTVDDLKQWRASLLDKKGLTEASARRITNTVRAALNVAVRRHAHKLGPSVRDVIRDGLAVPKGSQVDNGREKQILTDADIRRVIDAAKEVDAEHGWAGDLYHMVLVLAATGARFSQVTRLRVADLQVEQGRLMVPTSRKGSSGGKMSHVPVPLGSDVVDVLKRAVAGRKGHEPLLMRPRWRRAPGGAFGVLEIYARGPWGESHTLTDPWKRVIAKAGLSPVTVPYSLRHSSIVRGLRSGLPTRLTAALHDTSSLMVERFYGAHISDALGELARRAVVPLVSAEPASIRSVR